MVWMVTIKALVWVRHCSKHYTSITPHLILATFCGKSNYLCHFINGETEDWKKVKELAQGHRTSNGHAGALSWAVWAWSPALTTVLLVSSFKRLRCLDLWLKNFCDFFTSVPVWNQRNGGGRTIHLRVWNQTYSTPPSFQSSGNTPT